MRIVKVSAFVCKNKIGSTISTIENGEKERKKERKKNATHRELLEGAVRMSMLVAEDMMRDDVCYKKAFYFFWRLFVPIDFAFFLKMKVKVLLCFEKFRFIAVVLPRVHRILFTAYHFLSVVVRIYSQNLSVIFINVFYFALVFNLNFIHVHVMKDTVLSDLVASSPSRSVRTSVCLF